MKDYTRELKIAEIIARQEWDDISVEDQEFLHNWLDESGENAKLYQKLLQNPGIVKSTSEFDLDKFVDRTMQKIHHRRIKILVARIASVAAVLLIGIFVVFLLDKDTVVENQTDSVIVAGKTQAILSLPSGQQIELSDEEEQETAWVKYAEECEINRDSMIEQPVDIKIDVSRGGEYKVRLDDGTVVWLNSESSLCKVKYIRGIEKGFSLEFFPGVSSGKNYYQDRTVYRNFLGIYFTIS